MDQKELDTIFSAFLRQDRIYEAQYNAFRSKTLALIGGNGTLKNYAIPLLDKMKCQIKNGVYIGVNSLARLKNEKRNDKSAEATKRKPRKEKSFVKQPKEKKHKKKYVVPESKNRFNEEDGILMKLRIEYIREKYTVSLLASKLYFKESSLIEAIESWGFQNIKGSTVLTMDHIKPLAHQIYDRRNEILQWESEIVSPKLPKTKPNYFKLIYNSPGSKR